MKQKTWIAKCTKEEYDSKITGQESDVPICERLNYPYCMSIANTYIFEHDILPGCETIPSKTGMYVRIEKKAMHDWIKHIHSGVLIELEDALKSPEDSADFMYTLRRQWQLWGVNLSQDERVSDSENPLFEIFNLISIYKETDWLSERIIYWRDA